MLLQAQTAGAENQNPSLEFLEGTCGQSLAIIAVIIISNLEQINCCAMKWVQSTGSRGRSKNNSHCPPKRECGDKSGNGNLVATGRKMLMEEEKKAPTPSGVKYMSNHMCYYRSSAEIDSSKPAVLIRVALLLGGMDGWAAFLVTHANSEGLGLQDPTGSMEEWNPAGFFSIISDAH